MKRGQNAGFSLVEVLVAIAVLAAIVIPVCSSMVLSTKMNAKAEAVLQARVAVSSAVETLMAQGITQAPGTYNDLLPKVDVAIKVDEEADYYKDETQPTHYIVEVTDDDHLVTVTTNIRAVEMPEAGGEGTQ